MKRAELLAALAKAEHLRQRNDDQARRLGRALGDMADHATTAASTADLPEAKRALHGRALARRLIPELDHE